MRPKSPAEDGAEDLFRSRLANILDPRHELLRLAARIDWGTFDAAFGPLYAEAGRPGLPTRLLAGLHLLKHAKGLSDEQVCAQWVENPYFQAFCGEAWFRHRLPLDRSSMTRWRQRMGEEKLTVLLQESLHLATRTGATKPADFTRVIVDTTVQPKAVAFPTDARLLHRAREGLVKLARKHGVALRQSYKRLGKSALIRHQRHACQAVPARQPRPANVAHLSRAGDARHRPQDRW